MKFFHQKFLKKEVEFKYNSEEFPSNNISKFAYLLNQFLIWVVIFLIIYAILVTLANDFNW